MVVWLPLRLGLSSKSHVPAPCPCRLLQRGAMAEALSLAQRHERGPHFARSLEWLLFTALEYDTSGPKPAQRKLVSASSSEAGGGARGASANQPEQQVGVTNDASYGCCFPALCEIHSVCFRQCGHGCGALCGIGHEASVMDCCSTIGLCAGSAHQIHTLNNEVGQPTR